MVDLTSKLTLLLCSMNEPHDVPDIVAWAGSVQAAVTAIRKAGATSQMILLPGNNWASAEQFISSGSADALSKVTNLDGSVTNLVFDVHSMYPLMNAETIRDLTIFDFVRIFRH
jgi:ActR/RegA family two-component response regulator